MLDFVKRLHIGLMINKFFPVTSPPFRHPASKVEVKQPPLEHINCSVISSPQYCHCHSITDGRPIPVHADH